MEALYELYLVITLAGTVLLAAAAYYGWTHRKETYGADFFTLMMLAGVFANLMYLGIGVSQTQETAFLFGRARFFGVAVFPGLLLCFSLAYTGRRATWKQLALSQLVPALGMLLLWTNSQHHLIYRSWTIHIENGMVFEDIKYATGYFAYLVYQYALLVVGFMILLGSSWQSRGIHKHQYQLVAIGAFVVAAFSIPSTLGWLPFTYPSLNQFGAMVIGVVFLITFFRFRLLDIRPIAHDMVFENMQDGVLVIDRHGRIANLNTAVEKAFGCSADQAVGKLAQEVFTGHVDFARWLQEPHQGIHEMKIVCGTAWHIYELRDSAIRLETGDIVGRVILLRDVTEIRAAQEQAMQTALAQEKMKIVRMFVASSSHDLRTPLTTINTNVYLLRKTTDPAARDDRLDIINQQTLRLSKLIEQLHELVRLSESPELEISSVKLHDFRQALTQELTELTKKKNITLEWQEQPATQVIKGDLVLLVVAFEELLHNALVYTPEGGNVTVRARIEGHNAIVEVEDDGIGIAPEHLPYIFDPFYKVDTARTTDAGGGGLGLATAKIIADIHGGSATVSSTPEQGSTFRLTLPIDG